MGKIDLGIVIGKFMEEACEIPVLDVRTPAEFAHGHIPGAVSFPLFENEERARIGTLYNHAGSDEAVLLGLEIIGPRLREYAEKARALAPAGKALLYCWRGGMRSNSLAWLLNTSGMKCRTLQGGYKSYRRFLLEKLADPLKYILVGGMTGTGKTDIIHELKRLGEQVLDLEELASHKGSAFGAVGMGNQPTQEQFENELFKAWVALKPDKPVWLEDESVRIGRLFVPTPLYTRMQQAPVILVTSSLENRIRRLIRDYSIASPEVLTAIFTGLKKRLGEERMLEALEMVKSAQYAVAARIALHHYDKVYARQLGEKNNRLVHNLDLDNKNLTNNALELVRLRDTINFSV
jgi:tRNA 2-selenouridine synthase